MVVCRYFMQGTCKFGNNCRFDHPDPNAIAQQGVLRPSAFQGFGGNQQQSATSWVAGGGSSFGGGGNRHQGRIGNTQGGKGIFNQAQAQAQSNTTQDTSSPSVNEIFTTITQEMGIWDKSHMWPFSCFGYTKAVKSLPGLEDMSPEEIRLQAYEANKSGNVASYQQLMTKLATDYSNMRLMLAKPDTALRDKLMQFIVDTNKNTDTQTSQTSTGKPNLFTAAGVSPLNAATGQQGQQPSVFGAAPASKPVFGASGVFGNNSSQMSSSNSVFGATSSALTTTGQNLFGNMMQNTNQQTQSVFGNASQAPSAVPSAFGSGGSQSVFGNTQTQPSPAHSTFSSMQAQQTAQSVFGNTQTQPNSAQSVFGSSQTQPSGTPSVFGSVPQQQNTGQSVFGTTVGQQAGNQNVLGNTQQQQSSSVFGGPTQQASSQSVFGNTTVQPVTSAVTQQPNTQSTLTGITQQPQQQQQVQTANTTNLFGQTTQNVIPTPAAPNTTAPSAGSGLSAFSFAAPANQNQATGQSTGTTSNQPIGLFGKPASVTGTVPSAFGGTAFGATSASSADLNPQWFTAFDQLSLEEKEQFQSDHFATLAKVPIRPPPAEMCK